MNIAFPLIFILFASLSPADSPSAVVVPTEPPRANLPPAPVGPTPKEQDKIRELIHRLSNTDFEIRDAAHLALADFSGKAYLQLLEAESTSTDAETRHRCELLIPAARAAHFQDRIDAFLADTKGEYKHDIPGLEELWQRTQNRSAAREFFVKILQEPSTKKILLIGESNPEAIPSAVQIRVTEIHNRHKVKPPEAPPGLLVNPPAIERPAKVSINQATPVEILSLLYCDTLSKDPNDPITFVGGRRIRNNLTINLYQLAFRNLQFKPGSQQNNETLSDEDYLVAREIVKGWFESRQDPLDINIAINYSIQFDMPDVAISLSKKMLAQQNYSNLRGTAISVLGRFSHDKEARAELEKLLNDKTRVIDHIEQRKGENGRIVNLRVPIQTRDIALAMLIYADGLAPTDFGMKVSTQNEKMKYLSTNHWFETDEDRTAGFEKYEREKKQKKTLKHEK
ncbi:MAG: hypothetical protein U0798_13160 [Gemmataceae bacterium]